MIVRLVRMTVHPDRVDAFLDMFDAASTHIRATDGCLKLILLQDVDSPENMTTYSHWASMDDLNAYRRSVLFKQTWGKAREMFAASPDAWSMRVSRSLDN